MAVTIPTMKWYPADSNGFDTCGDATEWRWSYLLAPEALAKMNKLMASIEDIVKSDCLEEWLEEIFMMPRQKFKDLSNQGFVYKSRRLRDLGNYKYSVLYQFLFRLGPHHGQDNIKWKLIQLAERYTTLHRAQSDTDAGIEMRGDVIEYCLHYALMTGPAIADTDRESRLSFNRAILQFSDAYDSLILGLCKHPPIYRECPPPDWLSKAISQAVAAQTSRTKAPYYHLEYEASLALLNTSRKGTSSSCSNNSSNNSTHTV